jgi:predicted transcriptional regulator
MQEIARLTCQIVAAYCKSHPIAAADLPGLIASVGSSLKAQRSSLTQQPASAVQNPGSSSKARPAQARKQRAVSITHAVQMAPLKASSPPRTQSTNVVYLNFSKGAARSGSF